MKILVTSGGTTEYIDDVRVLTNTSTGKLGAIIAHELACLNFGPREVRVTYVSPKSAVMPSPCDYMGVVLKNIERVPVTDVASLMEVMKTEVPKHDVVIHAMAVSDFGFERNAAVKLKSSDPEAFAEYIKQNIRKNPKVISYIKGWNPRCRLIGFKFEVGKTYGELMDIAIESFMRNNCDAVIANDLAEMKREKQHIAYWVDHGVYTQRTLLKHYPNSIELRDSRNTLVGKDAIAKRLVKYVNDIILPEN